MLIRLLRTYLRPYGRDITYVVVLTFVGTLATLYLPTLNADIIDHGVVTGDTGTIPRIGAIMLGVTLVQIACSIAAVYRGARTAAALGRDVRTMLVKALGQFGDALAAQRLGRDDRHLP